MKSKKGFTLIELLAVIVILGLLMAIAVPTVTKYVNQSRKKALTMTVNNYMGALVTEVNSLEYRFKKENTIYAVPIECIPMSKGSGNPFGEWHIATEKYWAYVLVQYDKADSSYKYGFTFKDSNGNGMYPTAQNTLDSNGKDIVKKINILTPKTGKVTDLIDLENWSKSGFNIDETTDLVVLKVRKEGAYGNGKTTCTLKNKPNNYMAPVEEEEDLEEWKGEAYALVLDNSAYPNDNLPLIFVRSETPINAGDMYESDRYGNIKVLAAYTGFETTVYTGYYSFGQYQGSTLKTPWAEYSPFVTSIVVEDNVRFASMDSLFSGFASLNYADVGKIDISQNDSLSYTFGAVGVWWENHRYHLGGCFETDPNSFECGIGGTYVIIEGLENWDTSNVKSMHWLFGEASFEYISDISNWDTSSVTDMSGMFSSTFRSDDVLLDISKWDVSNVVTMTNMFNWARCYNFNNDLSNWNVSKVEDMSYMFNSATLPTPNISNWNTISVTNVSMMFDYSTFIDDKILDLSNWHVDKVSEWMQFNSGNETNIIAPSKFLN